MTWVTPEQASFTSRLHAYAYQGIERGLSIIPPREDGSKRPDGGWNLYQTRLPTRHEIDQWYSIPRTGIGIICGKVSGNLEMMEFEDHETYVAFLLAANDDGLSELINLISEGYMEESPNGGRHWLYRCPEIAGNTKLAQREDKKVLIETRGNGGYVIVAPSNGHVHPTDRPYKLLSGGFDTIANISKAERGRLHKLARSFDRSPKEHAETPTPAAEGSRSGVRPGDDYNKRGSWNELLEAHGWALMFTRGEVQYWRRPGKQTRDWSATVGHEHDQAGNPALWVFSTSTPFKSERVYNKFGAYILLKHEVISPETIRQSTKELGERGYGDPPKKPETKEEESDSGQSLADKIESRLVTAEQLIARPAPTWLVRGVLVSGTVATLYGEPGSYKTFVGLDMAISVAMNLHWQGFEVLTSPVIYISGEGTGGLGKRCAAWKKTWGIDKLSGIEFFPGQLNLLDAERRSALAEVVRRRQAKFLVVDTLARAMPGGNENSSQDVGLVYSAADECREMVPGLTALVVHHTTKEGGTYRGSSLIEGNSDTMIECLSDLAIVTLKCAKQKDEEQFAPIGLRREVVDVQDVMHIEEGQSSTSCVVRAFGSPVGQFTAIEKHAEAVRAALQADFAHTGAGRKDLSAHLGLSDTTVSRAINYLLERGEVLNEGTKARPVWKLVPETLFE